MGVQSCTNCKQSTTVDSLPPNQPIVLPLSAYEIQVLRLIINEWIMNHSLY